MVNRIYKSGVSRDQLSLLPARIEDYVGPDSPVRAIEAYVCSLDLKQLGFRHAGGGGGAGQPSYDPADLLKLYLYGYLNRVRSSRRLEQEAGRNLELIWLLKGLEPRHRTIANFRKENWAALKAANREFVVLARELSLLGGDVVAIDGAFFHGDASKGSIKTRKRLAEQLAAIERDIEAYGATLEANDATEEPPSCGGGDDGKGNDKGKGEGIADKLRALMERRAKAKADLARLDQSGQTQLATTDADARLLSKSGQRVAGYNVQIAVDAKHKLIVSSEVVNDGNDSGQLHPMALAAKEVLGGETLQVLADSGYYNGTQLKACEDDGIVAYVPQARRTDRMKAQGRFSHEEFSHVADLDAYRCPAGQLLTRTPSLKVNGSRLEIRYVSRKAVCDSCPLRGRCVEKGSQTRTIHRWVHEDVIDRHRARMRKADSPMRRRGSLVEHPFGTLKTRAGYRHFLVRGFNKVRGEWSLMALCYNFSRLLSILGFDAFTAHLANRQARLTTIGLFAILGVITELTRALIGGFLRRLHQNSPPYPLGFRPAA